jgi:cytochrome c oxidase subunit 1
VDHLLRDGDSLFRSLVGALLALGVSRRHWDVTFSDAAISFDHGGAAFMMLALNGVSAILASIGGILYVLITVGSILFGRRRESATAPPLQPAPPPVTPIVASYGSEATLKLPGTIVLVGVFFVAFVLYYFVNWKFVAELWPLK